MAVRFIVEVAWQAHFVTNMFIQPTAEELANFEPDFIVYNASKAKVENFKELGLNSETAAIFNITSKEQVILNTWYGGEMKKGMFSMMNYFLPLRGMASMHCSANTDMNGENTALFFGLSGTGKTTLSTDPKRLLIGDDEHGWDDEGVFNFEGGCYAKCINLKEESEPEIYHAIKFGALVENVIMDEETREFDFDDNTLTENTRVGYPVDYISNAAIPGVGGVPKAVVFLTADAFGVLPPISKLTREAAMYHFVTGFTSKVAGTERGITEPVPTFSTLFGEPFMPCDPSVYANMLGAKLDQYGTQVYLVNTGWAGGSASSGAKRMKLAYTRAMVTAALNGELATAETVHDDIFNLEVPTHITNVPDEVLIPKNYWKVCGKTEEEYYESANKLADMFENNFAKKYANMDEKIVAAGPHAKK
jgi:phosphoenolpyruvate carboxykinase (ATP)